MWGLVKLSHWVLLEDKDGKIPASLLVGMVNEANGTKPDDIIAGWKSEKGVIPILRPIFNDLASLHKRYPLMFKGKAEEETE